MRLDYKEWGMLVVFGGPERGLLNQTDLFASREAAQTTLGREPDFHDSRVASWGRLTLAEAQRLIALESNPDPEFLAFRLELMAEFFDSAAAPILTLYYTDWNHAY